MKGVYNQKDLVCIHCKIPIPKRMPMANDRGGVLHKGMIMLCSACGGAMILGDSDWRPLTKEDFAALPLQAKRQLVFVANQLRAKLGAGAEWSPYDYRTGA